MDIILHNHYVFCIDGVPTEGMEMLC